MHAQRTHEKGDTHLKPKCRTLADRRELRGLEVGEAEGRQVAVLGRKCGEAIDHDGELLKEEGECLANEKDRKSTRLNSSHSGESRMPSSA